MTQTPPKLELPEFNSWFIDIAHEIEVVQGLLAEDISTNPSGLYQQLSKANAFHARMIELLADATSQLLRAEYFALMSADKELTAKDRDIVIKFQTLNERRLRDILDGLTRSLHLRSFSLMNSRKQNIAERTEY